MPAATKSQLVGTWRLESMDILDSPRKGDVTPWGRRPEGLITYTPEGCMFVAINCGELSGPGFSSEPRDMLFYAGRWELKGPDFLTHTILYSCDIQRIGVVLERDVKISSGKLTIIGRGVKGLVRLVWKKIQK